MAYAVTPADIEARWRPLSADEQAVAAVLLQDAAVLLDTQFPTLSTAVSAELVPASLVTQVLVAMVKRVLVNPDALRSASIGGDLSVSWAVAPDLTVSASELGLLSTALTGSSATTGGAFTIRPVAVPWVRL